MNKTIVIKKKKLLAIVGILTIALIMTYLCSIMIQQDEKSIAFNCSAADNTECVNFLYQFGWEADPVPISENNVTIPATFDSFYQSFNEIQVAQGFDLEEYKGEQAVQKTFTLLNYPNDPEHKMKATLLIKDNLVIGADIFHVDEHQYIHGVNLSGTGLDFGQYIPGNTY